jgi:hypothetical protein
VFSDLATIYIRTLILICKISIKTALMGMFLHFAASEHLWQFQLLLLVPRYLPEQILTEVHLLVKTRLPPIVALISVMSKWFYVYHSVFEGYCRLLFNRLLPIDK